MIIEWADEIDDRVNDRIHAFAQTLRRQNRPEITDLIPAYSSLVVCYDPIKIAHSQVYSQLEALLNTSRELESESSRLIEIPTRYGGEFGPDLGFICKRSGLSENQVISLHASATYRVYMLGFVPGFAYLGSVPLEIAAPRLESPRTRVPAGSVGVAGRQTGVYPVESPGGWRLIGRTEIEMFDPTQDPPTLLRPGDRVRFRVV
jgi:KipI family sensor histidine kinase inhibitor